MTTHPQSGVERGPEIPGRIEPPDDATAVARARAMHIRQIDEAAVILRAQGAHTLADRLTEAGPDGSIDAVLVAGMVDAAYYQRGGRR